MQLTEQEQQKLNQVRLDEGWKAGLAEFLLGQKMQHLGGFLREQMQANKVIYPPNSLIFNALNTLNTLRLTDSAVFEKASSKKTVL